MWAELEHIQKSLSIRHLGENYYYSIRIHLTGSTDSTDSIRIYSKRNAALAAIELKYFLAFFSPFCFLS